MTEISIPYWLKYPFLLILRFFKLGLKKIVLLTSIFIFAIFISLVTRAIVMIITADILKSVT